MKAFWEMANRLLMCAALVLCNMAWAGDTTATTSAAGREGFPARWFEPVPKEKLASWEVGPQDAGPGEVILSKRNELGLLSNFANTTFTLDGKTYPSLEGFWQMMLYPEGPNDERAISSGITWKFTRDQVSQMIGFEANAAGAAAKANLKKLGITWVSYQGRHMPYYVQEKGPHYDLIVRATRAKLAQNPEVGRILLATKNLKLLPDHHQPADAPPAWHYFDIYMMLRDELMAQAKASKP